MYIKFLLIWIVILLFFSTLSYINVDKYRTEKVFCEEQNGLYEFGGFIGIYSNCIVEKNGEFLFYQIRGNRNKMILIRAGVN